MKGVDPSRLVFVDEAAANLAMSRSHAWIRRGQVLHDPRPMNWGTSMTMIGALRRDGWITMRTIFATANGSRFVRWVRECLAPKLHFGDIVVMDNAKPHKNARVIDLIEARGARLEFLPPYSPDLNPIESGWSLTKQHIKAVAPREPRALRNDVTPIYGPSITTFLTNKLHHPIS